MASIEFKKEVYDLTLPGLRKMLHDEVNEAFNALDGEVYDGYEDELDTIQTLISNQAVIALEDGFWANGELTFTRVKENEMLVVALCKAGYKVEESNASRSIYVINDNGQEIRISDHKRPAFQTIGGSYSDHDYTEVIVEDNTITNKLLRNNGISKLEEECYYLS
ncbi:hypothetical protein HCA68_15555 [Listeria booriae]|uniref:Uncharacterized protein n=2 Tax=Listeria booriae TaxID=1552123 RepID=A0A7X0ZXU8_9LIST|nr:hypothetical protein [Listeria booriae]MBC1899085.1 hypothetical protein [Listeria booriae]MBC2164698.1 hypothetical protein [Listeria booriae]MBC2312529.1 hypothetical protein [Listeria booriae]